MSLEDLARRCELVSQQYASHHGVDRDEAWRLLKLQEEVGELTRALLRRREGRPVEPGAVADELADVVAQALLIAHHEGVDLGAALDRKWLSRLDGQPEDAATALTAASPARRPVEWPLVLGVDGCRAGWFGVLLGRGPARAMVAPTLAELLDLVDDVECVAVDIPMGLPDAGERAAEGAVRARLTGRTSSVFSTLVREAYEAETYDEGLAVHRRVAGKGFSKQSWALRAKILEADAFRRSFVRAPMVEVHPELSFAHLAGAPMAAGKKTPEGRAARREALVAVGIHPPHHLPGGVAEDDLLDACAAAWSAARVARGEAVSHPEVPETFSDGWPAAIWA
jgi:predicted RNase H-like nuclease/NTP pyrophosphatase (non-canonical NTP hydrolase)